MRQYKWQEWIIPHTPCPMIGKNYTAMKEIIGRLMDKYPEYEFRLNGIAPHTWQIEYSL